MFIVVFIYFFEEGYGEVRGRKRGEGKREMSRDMERERDCVGARENWSGLILIIFRPNSFRLSQPGPRLHPGSLAVLQQLGPDHLPLRLSLPTLAFPLHRRHPALSPPPNISLFLSTCHLSILFYPRTLVTPIFLSL